MATITEIAQDVYRISIYEERFDLQFNQFLVKDAEPLLYHTGMRAVFQDLRDAVSQLIEPSALRWICWSHFEADECGSLNPWLELAPQAQAVCSEVGAMVNISDFALRPPKGLTAQDTIQTGSRRFRFHPTPHLPHGWDSGFLFEETQGTLFCSDLLHQSGRVEPLTHSEEVFERAREVLLGYQQSPLRGYLPYTASTGKMLRQLGDLHPRTLAAMHGSSFAGDCRGMLFRLDGLYKEIFGEVG